MRKLGRLTIVAVLLGAVVFGAPAMADIELLNVSYDPTRELTGTSTRPSPPSGTGDRRADHDPHVARRLGRAGPRRDRWARGRRRDAGARRPHRCHRRERPASSRPTGRSACRATARPTPRPSSSWCGGATRRRSMTGTTWQARHPGDHAEPENLRRSALELPCGLGLRPGQVWGRRGQDPGIHARHLRNVPILDAGARGSTTTFALRGLATC